LLHSEGCMAFGGFIPGFFFGILGASLSCLYACEWSGLRFAYARYPLGSRKARIMVG
jgi:hypothetical protein